MNDFKISVNGQLINKGATWVSIASIVSAMSAGVNTYLDRQKSINAALVDNASMTQVMYLVTELAKQNNLEQLTEDHFKYASYMGYKIMETNKHKETE